MTYWEQIWRFDTERFSIVCEVTPEDDSPSDHFEDQEIIEAIRNGNCAWFTARVRVLLDGREVGADYLGACAYENAEDFISHDTGANYFRDMVREAIAEARETLSNMPQLREV